MRRLIYSVLVPLLLPAAVLWGENTEFPFRTWTSAAGSSIEARYRNRSSTNVITLERKDGSTLTAGLGQLSQEDQTYLEELAAVEGRPERILFIGNSYTAQIRGMFTRLLAASPYKNCEVHFISPGGKTLKGHLENKNTMNKIREGNWDIVVLQEQSQTPAVFPDRFLGAARKIDRIIDDTGAQTVFYETWGRRDGDKQNSQRVSTYTKMQDALSKAYARAVRSCDAKLAPVGRAWKIVRKEHPALGIALYQGDGSHPSAAGAYLAACVLYATLFDADPTQVDFDSGLPQDHVQAIQSAIKGAM